MTEYFVSTTGSDSNPGTSALPWLSIQHAQGIASLPGDIVRVQPGIYNVTGNINCSHSGTPLQHIVFQSVVRHGAQIVFSNTPFGVGWNATADYVDVIGFDLIGDATTRSGLSLGGNFCTGQYNRTHDLASGGCTTNGGQGVGDGTINGLYVGSNNGYIGNTCYNIGTPGTECDFMHGVYLKLPGSYALNNICWACGGWAIQAFHAATSNAIFNNLIFNNFGGITLGSDQAGGFPPCVKSQVLNNIIYNVTGSNTCGLGCGGSISSLNDDLAGDGNLFSNNLIQGDTTANGIHILHGIITGTIRADPQFVNYQADGSGDYHLNPTSPCVQAGTIIPRVTGYELDYDGQKRPSGSFYDIGIYQQRQISFHGM